MSPAPVFAAVQMTSTEDVERNLDRASTLVRAAAAAGAQLVGLPENFAYLGADRDHKLALGETLPVPGQAGATGPILAAMTSLAKETRTWLLLGGFPERPGGSTQGGRIANASVLLDESGVVSAIYRKIHLFDVQVPGGQTFRESDDVSPGAAPVMAETPWGQLGLSICYDLRFPELYRHYAAAGARVVAVPSAFTLQTGKDHWHVLLRARAVENQVFVLAPAQFGRHGNGNRASYGHAMIVDPWGAVIAECGDHEGFALARLDLDYQDQVRQRLPVMSHRKL